MLWHGRKFYFPLKCYAHQHLSLFINQHSYSQYHSVSSHTTIGSHATNDTLSFKIAQHRLKVWSEIESFPSSNSFSSIHNETINNTKETTTKFKLISESGESDVWKLSISDPNESSNLIKLGQILTDKRTKQWIMVQAENTSSLHKNSLLSLDQKLYPTTSKLNTITTSTDNMNFKKHMTWPSSSFLLSYALEKLYQDKILICDRKTNSSDRYFHLDSFLFEDPNNILSEILEYNLENTPNLDKVKAQLDAILSISKQFHLKEDKFDEIASQYQQLVSSGLDFEKKVISIDQALRLFAYHPFKLFNLLCLPNDTLLPAYKCGSFIDIDSSNAPYVLNSECLKHMQLVSTNAADLILTENKNLQNEGTSQINITPARVDRLYAISFPSNKPLNEWKEEQEKIKQRDHRVIGKTQELFMMHPTSPGSVFFLPHGMRIYNKLMHLVQKEYRRNGYHEIATPILFDKELWVTSGHWANYQEDMFLLGGHQSKECHYSSGDIENSRPNESNSSDSSAAHAAALYGLKPMNCPGHCLMYQSKTHSYRDLPVRYAEFGALHRNEASGALTGLTRVRKFHQDDAHIFCTPSQMKQEIRSTLKTIDRLYKKFGFSSYEMALSTRPEKDYIGELNKWNEAEKILTECLQEHVSESASSSGIQSQFKIKQGDGAFYGPKIDVMVKDSIGRSHQLGTVQLDFNLPKRFHLSYQQKDGTFATPVMIHRAALGSLERMLAILTEHHEGKWPFWLSPRQIMVVPVGDSVYEYAQNIHDTLNGSIPVIDNENMNDFSQVATKEEEGQSKTYYLDGYYTDLDESDHTMTKKIREAFVKGYYMAVVVGEREQASQTVSIRERGRDSKQMKTMKWNEFLKYLNELNRI